MLKNLNLALLVLVTGFVPLSSARAMTANDYFADGNRLYRDDLYWAALLRYRQAAGEGMDTAVLHYNMGVAHYRAGQHIRARQALLLAVEDPALRIAAQYNLGLNAYKLGETEEALRWFRLARDQNRNKKLQEFAAIAITRILNEQSKPDDFEIRAAKREKKRNFADLELRARIGFGNDDNVFRSPEEPYVDLADPATPLVTPEVKSGAFMPVSLSAKYRVNSLKFEGFYVAYRLAGRYYQDKELDNANEYQHEASFGSEYRRKEGSREREIHSAFKVAQHDETYYDPDDGGSRIINGVGIDDRLDYLRYGPEVSFRQSHEKLAIGATIRGQLWNYEETEVVPEYDHEFMLLRLFAQYRFAPSSLFRVTLEGYSRRFGDRPAYDLDGGQRLGNPSIRYNYYSLGITARERLFSSFWLGLDAKRTERFDQYLGYNDYSRDTFGVEFHWTPGDRFDFAAKGIYNIYNFKNAFAFHDPAAGNKTQESARGKVTASYRVTRTLSLVAEARYSETVSNDSRIQYERMQYSLGVLWEQ